MDLPGLELSTSPFQVSTNGALSFSERLQRYSGVGLSMANTALIAPFWADVDTREIGEVFYRQTNESSCIANVTTIIRKVFEDAVEFAPFTVFITTWNNVGYSKRNTDRVSRNIVYYCSCVVQYKCYWNKANRTRLSQGFPLVQILYLLKCHKFVILVTL